ncbi:MAG: hypothetical protein V3V10_07210 [Planctomycetota bacterium]
MFNPKVEPVEASISYSSDNFTIEFDVPLSEHYGLIAVGTDAGLDDHFVRNMEQSHYKAITGSVDANQGVPLHQIAHMPRQLVAASDIAKPNIFAPFPGRLNDIEGIVCKLALEGGTQHNMRALKFAKRLPRTVYPMCMWPLAAGRKFSMTGYRYSGGDTISEVILYLVPLSKGVHSRLENCDRTNYPHWLVKKFQLAGAAATEGTPTTIRNQIGDGQSLRIRTKMFSVYDADGAVISETYANAIALLMRGEGDKRIFGHDADTSRNMRWLMHRNLADYQMANELGMTLRVEEALEFWPDHSTTANAKDCFLTLYGQIKPARV